MIPVTFASCFGWLHNASGNCGVVLCNAQGYEELCTHKSMRLLAESLAADGYPTLRFDYAGTGDSLGDDHEPDRLDAWLASLEAAIATLRETTGVNRIVLIGLRLGGALAALIADRLGTIDGLILLAPAQSGRFYGRELAALAALLRPADMPVQTQSYDGLDIAGFAVTDETIAALKSFNLHDFGKAPARAALILSPDLQGAQKLADRWSGLGCPTQAGLFEHYTEFMADAIIARVPKEAMATLRSWMLDRFPLADRANITPVLPPCMPLHGPGFIEEPVVFGESGLFGMLCRPERPNPRRPILIYLNHGANHHVSWGRMTVEMSRRLSGLGIATFRIDAAGIGDSPAVPSRPAQVLYAEDLPGDVSAAIDYLESRSFSTFAVVGICGGAHLSFHATLADPRISAAVMVNLQRFIWQPGISLDIAYREAYQSTGFYISKILEPGTWRRMLMGQVKARGIATVLLQRLMKRAKTRGAALASSIAHRASGQFGLVRQWFHTLERRGVKLLFIYSDTDAGLDELANYSSIRDGRLSISSCAAITLIQESDHNLTPRAARDSFAAQLESFLVIPEMPPIGHDMRSAAASPEPVAN